MATSRPFTYNTSSTVNGTEQIGDLAIGISPLDYSSNPGGLKWWMGADEDNRYVIGKDVSTKDWPTPVPEGDIGSVRFWATSTENDTQFIDLTNSIGGQTFTTVSESLGWLGTNGYWTNYNEAKGVAIQSASSNSLTNLSGLTPLFYQAVYNESNSDFYIANFVNQTSIRVPAVINGNDIPYSGGEAKQGVRYFLQTSSIYPTTQYIAGLAFKSSSNELFAASYGNISGSLTANYFSKWKVDEMEGLFTGSLTTGPHYTRISGSTGTNGYILPDGNNQITYNPQDDLLYLGGQYYDGSNFYTSIFTYPVSDWQNPYPDTEIRVKYGINGNNFYPLLFSSTDNSGKVLVMRDYEITSNVNRDFYITRNGSILTTGSFDAKLRVFSENKEVVYSEDQQKWYWGGTTYNFDGIWLASVDSNTYEVDRIQYEPSDQSYAAGDVTNVPIALDKNRNCIWALGRTTTGTITYYIYAIYLPTFSIAKYRIPYNPNIVIDSDNTTTPTKLYVDSNNDRLFIFRANGIYSWNLEDIWPI
jgi:hypothetical protein